MLALGARVVKEVGYGKRFYTVLGLEKLPGSIRSKFRHEVSFCFFSLIVFFSIYGTLPCIS